MIQNSTARIALKVLGVIVLLYIMIYAEVFSRSKEQYRNAEEAYTSGDFESASIYYARAVRMYGPGIPYNRKGIDRLIEIAETFESQNDPENALHTYEELAAAIRVIRSFYRPYHEIEMQARKNVQDLEPTVIEIQRQRRAKEEEAWRQAQQKQREQQHPSQQEEHPDPGQEQNQRQEPSHEASP